MNENTRTDVPKGGEQGLEREVRSIYRVRENVHDGWATPGIRSPMAFVFTLML
jgi:hypothetical protein